MKIYNAVSEKDLSENYFSKYFGGKFFNVDAAKKIGFIRENIENNKSNLTDKENYILLASLLYSADKIANTVGHFDAYLKKEVLDDNFIMK
jgi:adenine-specific DNA-methyltransferase